MKKAMMLLSIFLLLFLPFSVFAGENSVRVLDKDGNDVTKENFEDSSSKDAEVVSNETNTGEDTSVEQTTTKTIDLDASTKAAQSAFENALNGFCNGIIDSLFEGSVTIFETDIASDHSGQITYNINVKTLDPLAHPLVRPALLITGGFVILVTLITMIGSNLTNAYYIHSTEKFGDWTRNLRGEYVPYDNNIVMTACLGSLVTPILYLVGAFGLVALRNLIIMTLPQTASGVFGSATDSMITRAITGVSIYVGAVQTNIGEYGVYAFFVCLGVLCIISDLLLLFHQISTYKKLNLVAWSAFGICCLCDIINMLATSFGVITSEWTGDSFFITTGIMGGAGLNIVIMTMVTVYAVLAGKKAAGV